MSQHVSEFHPFLTLNNIPLHTHTPHCLSIHPSMDICVVSIFWLWWITLLWTWVSKYLFEPLLLTVLGTEIPRSGIAGLYSSSIFNFLRNLLSDFCGCCPILHSYQQCTRVSISPHPCQCLLLYVFDFFLKIVTLLTREVISHCFDLKLPMINDVEHHFICLLAISMSSLENCLLKTFTYFLIELLLFCYWGVGFLYIFWK